MSVTAGDVLTRKTFTPNYLNHKSHEKIEATGPRAFTETTTRALFRRDDFIAVQHLLNNSKYGNRSILPELRVIDSGPAQRFCDHQSSVGWI